MEKIIINDLSIARQGETDFSVLKEQLLEVVGIVNLNKKARSMIRCSRVTVNQTLSEGVTLIEFVSRFSRDDRNRVLSWLNNAGPFWDDSRTEVDFDYFTFNDLDVTDQGLGELGRMHSTGVVSAAFSFQGASAGLYAPALMVFHGIDEIVVGRYDVPNFWDANAVAGFIDQVDYSELDGWNKMISMASDLFDGLRIHDDATAELLCTPFVKCAAKKILFLLELLNEVVKNTDDNGSRNEKAQRIIRNHFIGDNADFSDESERNKRDFRENLTFAGAEGCKVFAPWHGKVNNPKIRVHFGWPLSQTDKVIHIYYIGPKITKR